MILINFSRLYERAEVHDQPKPAREAPLFIDRAQLLTQG